MRRPPPRSTIFPYTTPSRSTMNCTGAGGTATASTIVTVHPKPSMTLSAAPAALASGQATTLTWSATNATAPPEIHNLSVHDALPIYDELHRSRRHRHRKHHRHGASQTQHDVKRRAGRARFRPGDDLNMVRHQCDGPPRDPQSFRTRRPPDLR